MADMKMVDGIAVPLTDEEQQRHDAKIIAFEADACNRTIRAQIIALENEQTPRRLREAVTGTDGGWLANINSKISGLRAQLT